MTDLQENIGERFKDEKEKQTELYMSKSERAKCEYLFHPTRTLNEVLTAGIIPILIQSRTRTYTETSGSKLGR